MRHVFLCLSMCLLAGCGESYPEPPPETTAPVVTNDSLKELLKGIEQSGFAGSGMQQIRIGVEASGKAELKKDMEELSKADSAGQTAKVKQLAAKMLKDL